MKTQKPIVYKCSPYGYIATIPANTTLEPASNLPDHKDKFWARPWKKMSETAQSWHRNYGFLITRKEAMA